MILGPFGYLTGYNDKPLRKTMVRGCYKRLYGRFNDGAKVDENPVRDTLPGMPPWPLRTGWQCTACSSRKSSSAEICVASQAGVGSRITGALNN